MLLKKLFSIFAVTVALSGVSVGFAEDHPVGAIKGNQIDLKTYDHAIAGSIKDFVIWGFVNEETFTSNIILRKDGQIIEATFTKQQDGRVGGVISHTVDNRQILTAIHLVKIDAANKTLLMNINGQEVPVTISGTYENDHFVNPSYTGVYNGETISFQVEGEACFGFSFHLVTMIFGAYLH